MYFQAPLITGRLVKRYKRFLADIILDSGQLVTAHCTSTGAMLGLLEKDARVWLSPAPDPRRKLPYTWEMVESEGTLVGVNTGNPNKLVHEAILEKRLAAFEGYASMRREVKYGKNSRIDLLLEDPSLPSCYIEIKNVHLKRGPNIQFPDAVTERGAKHLEEMIAMVQQGHRAAMVYVIQRMDGESFSFARDIDPHYACLAKEAHAQGVEIYAHPCLMTPEMLRLQEANLPLIWEDF